MNKSVYTRHATLENLKMTFLNLLCHIPNQLMMKFQVMTQVCKPIVSCSLFFIPSSMGIKTFLFKSQRLPSKFKSQIKLVTFFSKVRGLARDGLKSNGHKWCSVYHYGRSPVRIWVLSVGWSGYNSAVMMKYWSEFRLTLFNGPAGIFTVLAHTRCCHNVCFWWQEETVLALNLYKVTLHFPLSLKPLMLSRKSSSGYIRLEHLTVKGYVSSVICLFFCQQDYAKLLKPFSWNLLEGIWAKEEPINL